MWKIFQGFVKISITGDFGVFWWLLWLLYQKVLVSNFSDYYETNLDRLGVILDYKTKGDIFDYGEIRIKKCETQFSVFILACNTNYYLFMQRLHSI